MRHRLGSCAIVLMACAGPAQGQGIVDRIARAQDGTVRLAFAVRDGICGDGETYIRDRTRGNDNYIGEWNGKRGWRERPCEPGPARVAISKLDGSVTRVKVYVGGDWSSDTGGITDLGTVSAPAAAKALVTLAGRERRAGQAIFAAIIADSAVVWPDLLAIAKNTAAPTSNRKDAVFWLSQEAGDAATKGLSDLAEDEEQDREVRDQAVFALSQLPHDEGVPILIRLARSNKDPKVRRKALF
ncbi:MAG TPA: HEAT repeat domain-containing protein, partial [Gemmatimonadales bacterium]|nr:HEAT repeat domain-containing protein [Gemmatimonadales bacterium]